MNSDKEVFYFLRFLKENGLYGRFKAYFRVSRLNKKRHMHEFLKHTRPYFYLSGSFLWCETNEGRDFWENKCNNWRELYENEICPEWKEKYNVYSSNYV